MTFRGVASDVNGEADGIRSGCWIVNDHGVDHEWSFYIGTKHMTSSNIGEGLIGPYTSATAPQTIPATDFTTGSANICLCSTVACGASQEDWETTITPGDYLLMETISSAGATYLDDANAAANRPMVRVNGVGDSDNADEQCGTGGVLVAITPGDFDMTSGQDIRIIRVDPRYLVSNVVVENLTFVPNNPHEQRGYGSDAILATECGTVQGITNIDFTPEPGDQNTECDMNPTIGMFGGFDHQFRHNAIHHVTNYEKAVIDGEDGCYGCAYTENYLGQGAVAASYVDTGTGWEITKNWFAGCAEYQASTASCIRTLGETVLIEDNVFQGVGRSTCDGGGSGTNADYGELCDSNSDCMGVCVSNPARVGYSGNATQTWFRNRFIGSNVSTAVIEIESGGSDVVGNEFMGSGGRIVTNIRVDSAADTVRITDNKMLYHPQFNSNDNFGGAIQVVDGAEAVMITDNTMVYDEPDDASGDISGAIRVGTDNAATANIIVTDNVLWGYTTLMQTETGSQAPVVTAPSGRRQNLFDGVVQIERGGDTYANANSACDGSFDVQGHTWIVSNSSAAGACDGAGSADARCYCVGSTLTPSP